MSRTRASSVTPNGLDASDPVARMRHPAITMTSYADRPSPLSAYVAGLAGTRDASAAPDASLGLLAQLRWRIQALEVANRSLRERAERDGLTGLLNRETGEHELQRAFVRARRFGRNLSVIMLDVDRFKLTNDQFGHDVGDAALRLVAAQCRSHIRDGDAAVRWGGDEFLIVVPNAGHAEAQSMAERLRRAISGAVLKCALSGNAARPVAITVSLGVATYDGKDQNDDAASLVVRADAALRNAKRSGRNCVLLERDVTG